MVKTAFGKTLYIVDKLDCAFTAGMIVYGAICAYNQDFKSSEFASLCAGVVAATNMGKRGKLEEVIGFWDSKDRPSSLVQTPV